MDDDDALEDGDEREEESSVGALPRMDGTEYAASSSVAVDPDEYVDSASAFDDEHEHRLSPADGDAGGETEHADEPVAAAMAAAADDNADPTSVHLEDAAHAGELELDNLLEGHDVVESVLGKRWRDGGATIPDVDDDVVDKRSKIAY